jgi:hypothetical protein
VVPVIREIPLSEVGLLSVADAAARKGVALRTFQKWVQDGLVPAVVAGGGMRAVHLFRPADVDAAVPPTRGAPRKVKSLPARKPAAKPRKRKAT